MSCGTSGGIWSPELWVPRLIGPFKPFTGPAAFFPTKNFFQKLWQRFSPSRSCVIPSGPPSPPVDTLLKKTLPTSELCWLFFSPSFRGPPFFVLFFQKVRRCYSGSCLFIPLLRFLGDSPTISFDFDPSLFPSRFQPPAPGSPSFFLQPGRRQNPFFYAPPLLSGVGESADPK